MPLLSHPHDHLFKATLDQPGAAEAFLQRFLPETVVSHLDSSPPVCEEGSYIDQALQGSQSDRLYRLPLRGGGELLLYVLIDHKSRPYPGILLQLGRYKCRIWETRSGGMAEKLRALPGILPVVVYHGTEPWNIPTNLRETLAVPGPLLPFMAELPYRLIDLGAIDVRTLAHPRLRSGFLALKYAGRRHDPNILLPEIWQGAADSEIFFRMLFTYIITVYREASQDQLRHTIAKVKPEWEERMVSVFYKEAVAEGMAQGMAQGMTQGIAQGITQGMTQGMAEGMAKGMTQGMAMGEARLLLRLLQKRFGPVSGTIEGRLQSADLDQLETWSDRLVAAETLEEIFG